MTLFKPYLDTVVRIFTEFEELDIYGRHEWLYERYSEFRKMTKVLLKQVLRGDSGGIDWFDTILTLSNLVGNFNLSIEPAVQSLEAGDGENKGKDEEKQEGEDKAEKAECNGES